MNNRYLYNIAHFWATFFFFISMIVCVLLSLLMIYALLTIFQNPLQSLGNLAVGFAFLTITSLHRYNMTALVNHEKPLLMPYYLSFGLVIMFLFSGLFNPPDNTHFVLHIFIGCLIVIILLFMGAWATLKVIENAPNDYD